MRRGCWVVLGLCLVGTLTAADPPAHLPRYDLHIDLDTGGEVVVPLVTLAEPMDPPRPAPPALAAPLSVGRLHTLELFRPPRTATLR